MACEVCMGINSSSCPVCGHEPEMIDCPDCKGTGHSEYWAVKVEDGEEIEVTETTWSCLPPTRAIALRMRQHYYQGPREVCQRCYGEGVIEDDRIVDDYFDEDAYMERRYERNYAV